MMTLFNWIFFKSNLCLLQYPSKCLTQIHHPWLLVLVLVPLLLRGSVSKALSATPESNASSKSTTQLSLGSNNDFQAWYEELRISPDGFVASDFDPQKLTERLTYTALQRAHPLTKENSESEEKNKKHTKKKEEVPDLEAEWWNPRCFWICPHHLWCLIPIPSLGISFWRCHTQACLLFPLMQNTHWNSYQGCHHCQNTRGQ